MTKLAQVGEPKTASQRLNDGQLPSGRRADLAPTVRPSVTSLGSPKEMI